MYTFVSAIANVYICIRYKQCIHLYPILVYVFQRINKYYIYIYKSMYIKATYSETFVYIDLDFIFNNCLGLLPTLRVASM